MADNREYPIKSLLKNLHQRPVAYFPIYSRITNSTVAGIVLSQLIYWQSTKGDEKFYKIDSELMEETQVSAHELKTAKKILKKLPFIEITLQGIPAKTFYRIDWEKLGETLSKYDFSQFGGNHQTCSAETTKLVRWKPPNYNTDTTPYTTSKYITTIERTQTSLTWGMLTKFTPYNKREEKNYSDMVQAVVKNLETSEAPIVEILLGWNYMVSLSRKMYELKTPLQFVDIFNITDHNIKLIQDRWVNKTWRTVVWDFFEDINDNRLMLGLPPDARDNEQVRAPIEFEMFIMSDGPVIKWHRWSKTRGDYYEAEKESQ
jgi:hypothetical protein